MWDIKPLDVTPTRFKVVVLLLLLCCCCFVLLLLLLLFCCCFVVVVVLGDVFFVSVLVFSSAAFSGGFHWFNTADIIFCCCLFPVIVVVSGVFTKGNGKQKALWYYQSQPCIIIEYSLYWAASLVHFMKRDNSTKKTTSPLRIPPLVSLCLKLAFSRRRWARRYDW